MKTHFVAATALLLLCATASQAQAPTSAAERQLAQDHFTIIAPFPPGGPVDTQIGRAHV